MSTVESPRGRRALRVLPVRLRDAVEERHPSWLELFFDLCFVAAVAALAAGLHHHPDAGGILVFAGLFVPVWWAWMGYTWHASAFDNDDTVFRLAWLGAMLLVIALASQVAAVTDGHGTGFALAYGLLQAVLALLFFRARRHETAARAFATRYGAGDAIGAAIWLASAAVPRPCSTCCGPSAWSCSWRRLPLAVMAYHGKAFNAAHIAERYGLFTLIVLGESVVAVAAALGGEAGLRGGLVAAIGFGVAACIWWVYFGSVRWSSLTRDSLLRSFTWGYGHLFVFAGVAATAVGVHLAADAASGDGHMTAAGYWIYAGGLDAVLLALVAIHFVTVMRWDALAGLRLAAALALAVLAAVGAALGPVWFSVCAFALLLALTIAETRLLGPAAADRISPQIGG